MAGTSCLHPTKPAVLLRALEEIFQSNAPMKPWAISEIMHMWKIGFSERNELRKIFFSISNIKNMNPGLYILFLVGKSDINNELLESCCYVVFQLPLNFDSAEEILKIGCQIYILMKKVIILRKIQATITTFSPRFFNHSGLSLNRKTNMW